MVFLPCKIRKGTAHELLGKGQNVSFDGSVCFKP